jgi:hypothetical protein
MYESQPDGPTWASGVLTAAQAVDPGLPEVDAIIAVARDPAQRHLGHDVFDNARRRYLVEEGSPEPSIARTGLLRLAEVVAKATFNETNTTAPFDFDSSWYIATCAVDLALFVGDPDYASSIRLALGDWPPSAAD